MRKLLIAFLVMVGMASCNTFKINVNLENSTGKTICLQRYDGHDMKVLDSVVAKNDMAVFKVKRNENLDAYCIMIKGWRRPLSFFADNQDVTITGDYQNYNGINVLASESQEKLDNFTKGVSKIEDEKEIYYYVLDFLKQNADSPTAPYVLYRYKWAFGLDDLRRIEEIIPNDMESAYKILVQEYKEGLERTQPGKKYIDFTQNDINGEELVLSKVINKSKLIILDFWASWCPDCRKENPNLVAIYNEFKDKGLDIVSVSLDTDEAAWKKAIADDNLSWNNHVSDLKGWNNKVADLYSIAFIPQSFVIDSNGMIVEKNLPFEKLQDLISMILQ